MYTGTCIIIHVVVPGLLCVCVCVREKHIHVCVLMHTRDVVFMQLLSSLHYECSTSSLELNLLLCANLLLLPLSGVRRQVGRERRGERERERERLMKDK